MHEVSTSPEVRRGDWIRADGSRFGARTIRDGRIKWLGADYRVAPVQRSHPEYGPDWQSDPEYDGRLDGLRALFYTYPPGTHDGTVFLHSFGPTYGDDEWPSPNCIDGYFVWEHWEYFTSTAQEAAR